MSASVLSQEAVSPGLIYRLQRFREPLKWSGTVFFAIGAVTISVSTVLALQIWPYLMFGIGHVVWTLAGILMRDRAVFVLNAMYLPLDVYAVSIRF